jgi:hypothetical protein
MPGGGQTWFQSGIPLPGKADHGGKNEPNEGVHGATARSFPNYLPSTALATGTLTVMFSIDASTLRIIT